MNLNWKISEKEGKNVSEKKEHIFENKQLLKSTTSLHLFLHQNDEKVGFGAEWLVHRQRHRRHRPGLQSRGLRGAQDVERTKRKTNESKKNVKRRILW